MRGNPAPAVLRIPVPFPSAWLRSLRYSHCVALTDLDVLTRRNIIELIAAGALLSPLRAARVGAQGLGTDYDVVVIGAGVAGLVAAQRLAALASEPKVLVLEARERIGGRVHSIDFPGLVRHAELGAMIVPDGETQAWPAVAELGLAAEALPDGRRTLVPSMSTLVQALAASSLGTVQLSSAVTDVFWRQGLVGVNYLNRRLKGAVTARRLIVTIPPTVLREAGPAFTPALPDTRLRAMAAVTATPTLSTAMLFAADATGLRDNAPLWVSDDDSLGLRASRAGKHGEVLLEVQFRGERAAILAGQDARMRQALALRSFGDVLERMPSVDDALWTAASDWSADPYSLGARLSTPSDATRLLLADSVGDTIFFAGDTTAATGSGFGLADAFASGERVAAEVARSLAMDVVEDPDEPIIERL